MYLPKYLVTSACLAAAFATTTQAAPLYSIRDLTPAGYSSSTAYDINASGDAVGIATRFVGSATMEAYFFYDHSAGTSTVFGVGTVTPRGTIVGSGFRRAALNDSGSIVGSAAFIGGAPESRGFIYSGGGTGTFTNLGVLAGSQATGIRPGSDAMDINNLGLATGTATSGAGIIPQENDNIDIYTGSASPITDIDGDITKATRGDFGRAINNAGLIAGSNQDNKATIFSGAAETVFLSSTSLASVGSVATDLNEVGQVTGHTVNNTSYIYNTTDSTLRILPNLDPAADRVQAKAINESGDTVGWGDRGAGLSNQNRGFVHDFSDNTSYILEDHTLFTGSAVPGLSDWERLRTAWGINDDGWIVGVGDRRFEGETFASPRAYLLIPVPEPASICLLLGLTCMTPLLVRRRASRPARVAGALC